jgi:photosystem II stability/assembly factor-like uncharacterized protein
MKKLLLILSIPFLLLLASCNKDKNQSPPSPAASDTLSAGWKKIQIKDSSGLLDIFFINNTGFAVSSNIYKSSDGGDNWTQLTPPTTLGPFGFINIGMGNEKNAIFVSTNHQLIATHNGGESFITNVIPDPSLSDVFFIDSSIAYAAGNSVWKTTDAGDNWLKIYDFVPNSGLNSVSFMNEQTGWILKKAGVYKTINGGTDWQRLSTDTISLDQGGAIFFLNSDTGYFSNNSSIEKTVNGGASWNKVFTFSYTTSAYHDIHFVSESVGYITDGRFVFKTTDGGNTWTRVVALASNKLLEVHFTDANHGWACGERGTILKYSQ